ncbi:MAG: tetratricopeptide repeat protein, partial [Candidatus Aminicenantes bacterium]|nr:tetratricopeptide repeat protein [Candidatus Aminicenantes bacterium]
MDYRKKLNKMDLPELEAIAKKLNVRVSLIKTPGREALTREEELIEAILKCPEKEIKNALGLDWWQKPRKPFFYIGLIGGLASIIALIFALWSHQSSQKENIDLKQRLGDVEQILALKIEDPAAVQRLKDEYEKKLASMEETLKNLKTGDKKARDEALKAFREGDYSKAKKLFLEIKEKESKKSALTSYNLGEIAFLELDFEGALAHFLEAGRLDPGNTLYQNEIGLAYLTLAEYQKAKDCFEKALASDMKTYGKEHPHVATRWNNLGRAWAKLGKYEKAIEYFEKALQSDLKTYGKEHPDVARDWNNLGFAWAKLGKYEKAIEYYEKAMASDMKTYGKDHPKVATYWNNLGGAWDLLGKYEKAIEY